MIKKKNISQEDINTWKNYIKSPTDITDKDFVIGNANAPVTIIEYSSL